MRKVLIAGLAMLVLGGLALAVDGPTAAKQAAPGDEIPWAFRAPVRHDLPAVGNKQWMRNPIDAFILAKMEKAAVTPAKEADRITLIRRLSLDLIGLPPTPEEVANFINDTSADAYEKVVDRLLASPRHGERWATFWLDLARYAETDGFKSDDPRPLAWRYRDYVIDAFNQDKPYDRFILEQLAGDELFPDDAAALVATGFNRHHTTEGNVKTFDLHRQEILNDMTETTSLAFMGLTIGCARCHDHKYDPILHTDFFRMQAFFAAYWPKDDAQFATPQEKAKYQKQMQEWTEKAGPLYEKATALEEPFRKKMIDKTKAIYDPYVQDLWAMPDSKRTPYEKQLAQMLDRQLQVDRNTMVKSMQGTAKKEHEVVSKELAKFDQLKPKPLPMAMVLTDVGPEAPPTYLLKRGNHQSKGKELKPGFLAIWDPAPAKIPTPPPGATTTGRRSVLAKWLVRPDHPLTARVMANRLWQHHFGRGIVATPSDYGETGERPTHPELLDWLATEFVKQGWSLKAMHKLMVTSATYRQSSVADASALKTDGDNRLFSRMIRRRLDGESLRDSMLAVSGLLNPKAGGPSVYPELPAELKIPKWKVSTDVSERNRRSVYVFAKRNMRYPFFGIFDAPNGDESCSKRQVSINAPQALMLLNGKITLDWSQAFAGRVLRDAGNDREALVRRAYQLALGREPSATEAQLARDFLGRETKHMQERLASQQKLLGPAGAPANVDAAFGAAVVDLCHVVLNLNEFAFVD